MDKNLADDLVAFTRELVRAQSYSGHEEAITRLIAARMKELG
jgi:acetylornithine deacetylase/succinyl-diaminopimelate desuccinylase-like protein